MTTIRHLVGALKELDLLYTLSRTVPFLYLGDLYGRGEDYGRFLFTG